MRAVNAKHSNQSHFKGDQSILIVDHYRVGQRIALLQLQYFGLTAHVVNSCRQAIKAVSKRHYSLVLIGWGMPECAGTSFIKFARREALRRTSHTTIVAVTAHARACDPGTCRALGIDDVLSKPISMSDMQQMLTKHLKAA
jgi:CheY-like chemotaxis protein